MDSEKEKKISTLYLTMKGNCYIIIKRLFRAQSAMM